MKNISITGIVIALIAAGFVFYEMFSSPPNWGMAPPMHDQDWSQDYVDQWVPIQTSLAMELTSKLMVSTYAWLMS